jgi:hypothetical protein
MPIMSLSARIEQAFKQDAVRTEFGQKYLELLLQSWAAIASAMRRTVTLIVALILSFLLLYGGKKAELSLGPLKVKDISSALTFVPAIISQLYYDFVTLLFANNRYEDLKDALVERLYPDVYASELHESLAPPTTSVWGHNPWQRLRATPPGRSSSLMNWLGNAIGIAILVGALAFLVFAYWRLLLHSPGSKVPVVISLAFVVFGRPGL